MSKRRRSSAVPSNVGARRSLFFAMQSRRIASFILANLSILTFVSDFASVAGPFSGRKRKKSEKTPRPPPSPTLKKSGNDYNLRKDVDAERVFPYYNRAFGNFQAPERENRPPTRDFPAFPAKKVEKRSTRRRAVPVRAVVSAESRFEVGSVSGRFRRRRRLLSPSFPQPDAVAVDASSFKPLGRLL